MKKSKKLKIISKLHVDLEELTQEINEQLQEFDTIDDTASKKKGLVDPDKYRIAIRRITSRLKFTLKNYAARAREIRNELSPKLNGKKIKKFKKESSKLDSKYIDTVSKALDQLTEIENGIGSDRDDIHDFLHSIDRHLFNNPDELIKNLDKALTDNLMQIISKSKEKYKSLRDAPEYKAYLGIIDEFNQEFTETTTNGMFDLKKYSTPEEIMRHIEKVQREKIPILQAITERLNTQTKVLDNLLSKDSAADALKKARAKYDKIKNKKKK
jgi:hypothetical protein